LLEKLSLVFDAGNEISLNEKFSFAEIFSIWSENEANLSLSLFFADADNATISTVPSHEILFLLDSYSSRIVWKLLPPNPKALIPLLRGWSYKENQDRLLLSSRDRAVSM